MKVQNMAALAARAVSANPTRPATLLAHDSTDARVVIFRIERGQAVPPHTSPSTVLLSILSGTGIVSGAEGEQAVKAGDLVSYAPSESHGMRAPDEQLVIAALIAPRPAAR